jgi:mannose-6-phosphate isomerase
MAIELARAQAIAKPWGVADLRPWSRVGPDGGRLVGEIWYERPGTAATEPSLLLKLLFTSQTLSLQVHPNDAYAQSMGLARGKTEAWYILSAAPGAKIRCGGRMLIIETFAPGCEPKYRPAPTMPPIRIDTS